MSNNLTSNLNMMGPGNFKVTIDSSEFSNLQFFCINANLPTLTASEVLASFKNRNAYMPGDTLEYGTFDVSIQDGTINYPKENGEVNKKD